MCHNFWNRIHWFGSNLARSSIIIWKDSAVTVAVKTEPAENPLKLEDG